MVNQREHAREPRELVILSRDARTGRLFEGSSQDVSLGGIFVRTRKPPIIGAELQFFVGGIGGPQVLGRVVHVIPGRGFGAKFLGDPTALLNAQQAAVAQRA
jgi:hypothetical protein